MLVTIPEATIGTTRRKRPTPLKCPQTMPYLHVSGIVRGTVSVQFTDGRANRAKPHGASELQLFVAVTDEHDAPLSAARFYRKFTKFLMNVEFEEHHDGKVATFYGRWASPRGETGPWSMPVSVRIVAR